MAPYEYNWEKNKIIIFYTFILYTKYNEKKLQCF